MNHQSPDTLYVEETRIKAVYEKRCDGTCYSWFNRGHIFLMQELERVLLTLLAQYHLTPLQTKQILDVGCGTGYWLREFIQWGADPRKVMGIDLVTDRVVQARALCPDAVRIDCGSAAQLAFSDATFDLVTQFTVFTSVLDFDMKQRIAAEMRRVVKPDGVILWYDYYVNNPWNPDVRGIPKREIAQLFPGCRLDLRRVTLVPPVARFLAPYSWLLCYALARLPYCCTHYLGVIQTR